MATMAVKGADGALFIDANTLVMPMCWKHRSIKTPWLLSRPPLKTDWNSGSAATSDPVVSSHLDPATGLWRSAETNSFDSVKPVSGTIQCADDNRVVTEKL